MYIIGAGLIVLNLSKRLYLMVSGNINLTMTSTLPTPLVPGKLYAHINQNGYAYPRHKRPLINNLSSLNVLMIVLDMTMIYYTR